MSGQKSEGGVYPGLGASADPRDPDYSRSGIFVHHNCWQCEHGAKPCVQGGWNRCDNPRARND